MNRPLTKDNDYPPHLDLVKQFLLTALRTDDAFDMGTALSSSLIDLELEWEIPGWSESYPPQEMFVQAFAERMAEGTNSTMDGLLDSE